MATPRKKRADASPPSPLYPQGPPPGYEDTVIGLIPALQELVAWWQSRKITLAHATHTSRQTERITFHVEQRWIEAIHRQANLDDLTYTQIVNKAFRQYFEGL